MESSLKNKLGKYRIILTNYLVDQINCQEIKDKTRHLFNHLSGFGVQFMKYVEKKERNLIVTFKEYTDKETVLEASLIM